jgi:SAM-dependent methyltransferase
MQMNPFWDKRYSTKNYAYGRKPNGFFSAQLDKSVPGRTLLPGEGEGRNAAYAALKGWSVDAFDQSSTAYSKAMALASEHGVRIHYKVCQLEDFQFLPNHYDLTGLIYFHLDGSEREYLHRKVYESLKPGGTLVLEAFHKEQLGKNTGGPKAVNMLYDEKSLSSDFASFKTLLLEKQNIVLDEGPFHQGEASVIRFIGQKPN